VLQQQASHDTATGHGQVEYRDEHRLRHVRAVAGGIGKRRLQKRRRTAKGQSPRHDPRQHQRGRTARQAQRQRGHGEHRQAQQRQAAQRAIHQRAHDPDAGDRGQAEHQQHRVHPAVQAQ